MNDPKNPRHELAWRTGQLLSALAALVVAGVVVLLGLSLVIVAVQTSWWLTQQHPIPATLAVMLGVLAVGRKL